MTQLQVETVGSVGNAAKLVATRMRYPELAPVTAVQLKLTGWVTPLAPFDGPSSVGAGRLPKIVTRMGADSVRTLPALSIACSPYQYVLADGGASVKLPLTGPLPECELALSPDQAP